MVILRIKYIGEDDWGRRCYKNVDNGNVYKDVDGVLHTSTKEEGEPECPIKNEIVEGEKMFRLTIKTGSAAFEPDMKVEIVRILIGEAARKISLGNEQGLLNDINGNVVGEFRFTSRKERKYS